MRRGAATRTTPGLPHGTVSTSNQARKNIEDNRIEPHGELSIPTVCGVKQEEAGGGALVNER
jgi:hypothetical protein